MIFRPKILYEVIITDHNSLEETLIRFSKIPPVSSMNDIQNMLINKIGINSSLSIVYVYPLHEAIRYDVSDLFLVYNTNTLKLHYSVKIKKTIG